MSLPATAAALTGLIPRDLTSSIALVPPPDAEQEGSPPAAGGTKTGESDETDAGEAPGTLQASNERGEAASYEGASMRASSARAAASSEPKETALSAARS